jgi:hypothetical protein
VEPEPPPEEVGERLPAVGPRATDVHRAEVGEPLGADKGQERVGLDPPLEGVHLRGSDSAEIDEDLGADVAVDALATGEASVDPPRLSDELEVEAEAAGQTGPRPGLGLNHTTRNDIRLYHTPDSPRERSAICRSSDVAT